MIYTTDFGKMYTGNCQDVLTNEFKELKGKVNLIFTSPPFPLNRAKKYGNMTGEEYLEWIANLATFLKDYLTPDGSIVIELGNAWDSGMPTHSTLPMEALLEFKRRGNFYLCQEFIYFNPAMYSFAMNIGGLFKLLHRDVYAKYPETNQFAFENEVEIESRPLLKEVRNSLIKWGVIVKRPRIQSISIGRRKGTLYYLNRIFSPIFGISFRTRGGYNFVMSTSLFESLLKEAWEAEKIKAWKDKKNKNTPLSNGKNCKSEENVDPNQISMFEV